MLDRGRKARGSPFRVSPRFMPVLALAAAAGVVAWTGALRTPVTVFAFVLAGWIVTLCLHEYGHALAAWKGGDWTVAGKGYLTLDPVGYSHMQLSLVLPVVFLALGGIGLPGGAVFVDHRLLRSRGWESFVAAAGPLMTLACLLVIAAPFASGAYLTVGGAEFWGALAFLGFLQASALVFNLLPIPGFDGFGVIAPYLPAKARETALRLQEPVILLTIAVFLFVPRAGQFIFSLSAELASAVGVDISLIGQGYRAFRFWR